MDEIEITLPVSGDVVVLRNYTTRDDDEKAEQILFLGVEAKQNGDEKPQLMFPAANIMASQEAYVPRLIKSINGDSSNLALRLKQLRSLDYSAISDKVKEIVGENSPKAKGVSEDSTISTNKK